MDVIQVEGGYPVTGTVTVEGAKNSALKLMAATLMASGVTTLTNVPNIADVHVMGKVLKNLGAKIEVVDEHVLKIDTTGVDSWETPYDLVVQMRASTAVLGPLLSRFGKAVVAMPGGCNIGARKIDMHILGLEALGVEFKIDHGNIHASTPNGIHGETVTLAFASVGATENLMMASVFAKGTTVIDNAAREPEIVDLANMLNEMGAHIKGAGSPVIEIEGVSELHPVTHAVVGDRIEAGTFLTGGALMGGPVTVRGIDPSYLRMALMKLEAMGCDVQAGADCITVRREGPLAPIDLQTLPHPGFPTDLQAQMMALLCTAEGTSVLEEKIFENRFMHAPELTRMGARIEVHGGHATVHGVQKLRGAPVMATDLRASVSLILAGLAAEGETIVSRVYHLDRGYEKVVRKLRGVGAQIERIKETPAHD